MMKIRLKSEEDDDIWFTTLKFSGDANDAVDWAYLIDCILNVCGEGKSRVVGELLDGMELHSLRIVKKGLDALIDLRSANLMRALADACVEPASPTESEGANDGA